MSVFENKAFIKEYLSALSGKEKTRELVDHYVAESDMALKQHILEAEASFPKYELIADDILADGDKVMIRARLRGTHQGIFNGIPATGKPVEIEAAVLYQVEDRKIINHWLLTDNLAMLQQLGVAPEHA